MSDSIISVEILGKKYPSRYARGLGAHLHLELRIYHVSHKIVAMDDDIIWRNRPHRYAKTQTQGNGRR
jgi:hypothetical protein